MIDPDFSEDDEFEIEPVKPDKANFIFGMHPLQAENVVIDPNYPPQFFPYLYPHLYPHLFPKLFPHYCQNYEKVMKKKDKEKKKKKDKRDIIVVLPDGRNIMMSRKEFLAYQLALAQMGHKVSEKDLTTVKKDPLLEDSKDDARSVALSANIPSEPDSPKKKKGATAKNAGGDPKGKDKDISDLLKGLDDPAEGPGKPKLLEPNPKTGATNTGKNTNQPSINPSSRNSKSNKNSVPNDDPPDDF